MAKKTISGFNAKTAENLMLDAGAFYRDFEVGTDTVETATAKLIGATRGGGKFEAKPSVRAIEVDGVKGRAKGLQVIDSWDVSMEANVLEITKETLKAGLIGTNEDGASVENYDVITAKNYIELTDYVENITYIGNISGSDHPVIIQLLNALNVEGLSLQTKDKDEAVIALKFVGSYDPAELDSPPFKIYYPKA